MNHTENMNEVKLNTAILSPFTSSIATSPTLTATSHVSITQRMVSASTGATLVALFTTPFDVIKTRMQSDISLASKPNSLFYDPKLAQVRGRSPLECLKESARNGFSNMRHASNQGHEVGVLEATSHLRPFKSTFDGFVRISHYEGIPALWKGLVPTLIMQAPSTIIYYLGYEEIRNALYPRLPSNSSEFYAPLIAGSIARAITTCTISPLELIRTRMQSGTGSQTTLTGVVGQLRGMARANGVASLWRGLGPTLWRDVPFSGIYWLGYETIKKRLSHSNRFNFGDFGNAFVAGASAGTVAAVITTPFDVSKTLQQVVHHNEPGCKADKLSMVKVMQSVIREDGVKGLFVGLSPRIAKIAPACAIMITTYESGKRYFESGSGISRS
ncbi:mitochondrial carrier domain-containing protein [Chytriomyces cf. hyalinus JEL632]|nr:mitochondrial carrier domain-containing protein [Chytriomyces cf. hyalinus JEL632]